MRPFWERDVIEIAFLLFMVGFVGALSLSAVASIK